MEEVGELIGHNDCRFLAQGTEELRPSETGTNRITVRTAVAGDDNVLAGFNQCAEPATLFWREDVDIHLEQFVRIDALVDKLLDASYRTLAVSGIGDTKPFRGSIEHLHRSSLLNDELIDHQGDKELGL